MAYHSSTMTHLECQGKLVVWPTLEHLISKFGEIESRLADWLEPITIEEPSYILKATQQVQLSFHHEWVYMFHKLG